MMGVIGQSGNTKGGSITLPLTSCLTGFKLAVWQTVFVLYAKQKTSETGGQWYNDIPL
jgi:hypothetical protein